MTLNLISGAWIPVRRRDGARDVIRPARIALQGDSNPVIFPDWPRPDLNIATLELLIGLLSTAMPPEDFDEWIKIWKAPPTADDLDEAFAPYAHAFNLDGDGPRFLQDFDELEDGGGNVEGLFIDSAGENTAKKNADIMVKRDRYACLSRPAAAIALYALQQFAPTGGAGHRTSMRGGGPLTTLAIPPGDHDEPSSLWELVWSNVRDWDDGPVDTAQAAKTLPWLAKTQTSENNLELHEGDETKVHPQQAFFGMPRRIRLAFEENTTRQPCDLTGIVDDVVVARYATRPYGVNYGRWQHPLTPYYRNNENDPQTFAMHPPAGRFGYRNWVANVTGDKQNLRTPAETIRRIRQRLKNAPKDFKSHRPKLLIAGWAMSNMKPLDYVLAEHPLHVALNANAQEDLDAFARRMVLAAEKTSKILVGSVQAALKSGKDSPKADSARITAAREAFFADTESEFHDILGKAAAQWDESGDRDDEFAKAWLGALRKTAFDVFDANIQPDLSNPERAHKVVEARKNLTIGLFGKGKKSPQVLLGIPIPVAKKTSRQGASA